MTPEILSRQAIRLAQRRSQKAGRALTRDEVLRLHIQTVEPWKRVLFVALGLLCGPASFVFATSKARRFGFGFRLLWVR
jgi:hypothetical protein